MHEKEFVVDGDILDGRPEFEVKMCFSSDR